MAAEKLQVLQEQAEVIEFNCDTFENSKKAVRHMALSFRLSLSQNVVDHLASRAKTIDRIKRDLKTILMFSTNRSPSISWVKLILTKTEG